MSYSTITTEGGLIPADILDAIAQEELSGQRPEDFGLERSRNLSDRISAAWQAARGQWALFQSYLEDLGAGEAATSETREQWVVPLLRVLGYRLGRNRAAYVVEGRTYAISHRAGDDEDSPPVHIEGIRASLDARPPSGRPRLSPHALMQEYLNGTEQLWGIVTNGERLRLLRDSARFTRPAYVEFDLRTMLEGEQFAEFAILYRLLHRTRLPTTSADAASCLLEKYHQQAVEAGGRVREGLRDGVEGALKLLGNGLLAHPANTALRARLAEGQLSPLEYYRQLLRLVYRLLFLMVAEERNLVAAEQDESDPLSPLAYRPSADLRLSIYRDNYSVSRLRRLAESSGAGRGPFGDLWLSLLTTFRLFEGSDEEAPRRLGLAPLDGDLFSDAACGDLTSNTQLRNADLLAAVRKLSLYREKESKGLRRVNYGALDVEELGSVYESLLDYRPVIAVPESGPNTRMPSFDLVAGTERKTTGSYYTRPELVQELIKSALVPVLEERLREAEVRSEKSEVRSARGERQTSDFSLLTSKEEAILSIRVCDPACGSGAFLLAAARRLGRELARIRAGEDQPSPTQFRHAVRDVIQRCIFGVDLNPLATDLCKLALWIEGHCAGLPLSFLDHHIKRGNSLIGATRALVAAGVPDDAYKAVTGDDKPTASSIKKRNRQERDLALKQGMVQRGLFDAGGAAGPDLAGELRALDEAADDSVAAVRAKAHRLAALRERATPDKIQFDLWTAAFFQPLTPANAPNVPTSKDVLDPRIGDNKAIRAEAMADEVGFFHWELEFPQVFAEPSPSPNGPRIPEFAHSGIRRPSREAGFDVVLGNPPWERIKLQEQEHFVDVPEIAGAANKAARDKAIAAWRSGDERQRARIAQFDAAKYRAEAESRFVRASERFPLTAVGDVNTYALFAEHSRNLLAPTGRVGILTPAGIVTDDTTKRFFGDLIMQQSLVRLVGFENEALIFPSVHHAFKFCAITMAGTGSKLDLARFVFLCRYFEHVEQEERNFTLSSRDILQINPNTQTAPVFRTKRDAELTKKLHRSAPVLLNENSEQNTWDLSFLRMIDMANDSELFHDKPAPGLIQLLEGKMIDAYNHRFANVIFIPSNTLRPNQPEFTTEEQYTDPNYAVRPLSWVPINNVSKRLAKWTPNWLIGFKDVTAATNERTAIFSALPRVGVGHTVPLIIFSEVSRQVSQVACFLAMANSLVFDYATRQRMSGIHLTYTILQQVPVLPPSAFSPQHSAFIVPRVVELVYTAWDIRAFAEDVWAEGDEALRAELLRRSAECNAGAPAELFNPRDGFPLPPYRWDEERRALIRAELDARIARLYGLTRDELRYILDPHEVYGPEFPGETFRVLKDKELKLYGEYRTRRLVLEAWDREEGNQHRRDES